MFSNGVWILVFALFSILSIGIGLWVKREGALSIESFLVANRKVGWLIAAMSIAATWIWAPALFVSAELAFKNGYVAFLWFLIPNVFTLIFFSFFADKLREKIPHGFTLKDYIGDRFGKTVHNFYLLEFGVLQTCSFAVQLVAGGMVLEFLTGIPFWILTILLSGVAVTYSLIGGLKASILNDYVKMALMLLVGLILVPWAIMNGGGFAVMDWNGINNVVGFLSPKGINVMLMFGIITAVGLISGPWGDQSFWQRVFAVRPGDVKKSFIVGALIFAIAPITLGMLGFLGAGLGITVANTQLINITVIKTLLPAWTIIPFTILLLSGLMSTLDSNLCAISSIAGVDIVKRVKGMMQDRDFTVKAGMISMVLLGIVGVLIANIPGITLLTLFLFYGTIRSTTFLPSLLALVKDRVSITGMKYGLAVAICIGVPIYAYLYNMSHPWMALGSLLTVLSSGVIAYAFTKMEVGTMA